MSLKWGQKLEDALFMLYNVSWEVFANLSTWQKTCLSAKADWRPKNLLSLATGVSSSSRNMPYWIMVNNFDIDSLLKVPTSGLALKNL